MPKMIATPDVIDTPNIYDYSATIVNGRAFITTARKGVNGGSDAIVSLRLQRPETQSPPFQWPGRLVADPFALRYANAYLVLFTVGMPDGKRNGVGFARTSNTGVFGATHTLIPQATRPDTYGIGQPSVACLPDGRKIVFARDDGPGAGVQRAWWLDTTGGRCDLGTELHFSQTEDGASVEWFWATGNLWALVAGGDVAGLRSYSLTDGMITRDRQLEQPGAWWRTSVPVPKMVDGCGIERDATNKPIIRDGRLTFWQGQGDTGHPGAERTWRLVRHEIPLP
ncbi:MAG: hypothetical protein ACRCZI_00960 [Cetobacterium sp.]